MAKTVEPTEIEVSGECLDPKHGHAARCPSCGWTIRQEYADAFPEDARVRRFDGGF